MLADDVLQFFLHIHKNDVAFVKNCLEQDSTKYLHAILPDEDELPPQHAELQECDGYYAFLYACRHASLEMVQLFVQFNVNAAQTSVGNNRTAYYIASAQASIPLLEYLQSLDVINIYQQDSSGYCALHPCIRWGHLRLLKYLIEKQGFDKSAVDRDGDTLLITAAIFNQLEIAKYLHEELGLDLDATSTLQFAALHLAAQSGSMDVLLYLIQKGSKMINAVGGDTSTPLYLACQGNHVKCVEVLLQYGADAKMKTDELATCLHCACKNSSPEIIKMLIQAGADTAAEDNTGYNCFTIAAFYDKPDLCKALHECGLPVDCVDSEGFSPLMIACQEGKIEVVKYLVENGAQLDLFSVPQSFPLFLAAQAGFVDIVKYLLECKAPIDQTGTCANTALNCSISYSKPDVAMLLIEHGADLESKNEDGFNSFLQTAKVGFVHVAEKILAKVPHLLHSTTQASVPAINIACEYRNLDMVQFLVQRGISVHVQDKLGRTPLYHAVASNADDIITFLLEHHANVNQLIGQKETSMHVSTDHLHFPLFFKYGAIWDNPNVRRSLLAAFSNEGETAIVQQLLTLGANVNFSAIDGNSALACAIDGGHFKLAKLLHQHGAKLDVELDFALVRHGFLQAVKTSFMNMIQFILQFEVPLDIRISKMPTKVKAMLHQYACLYIHCKSSTPTYALFDMDFASLHHRLCFKFVRQPTTQVEYRIKGNSSKQWYLVHEGIMIDAIAYPMHMYIRRLEHTLYYNNPLHLHRKYACDTMFQFCNKWSNF